MVNHTRFYLNNSVFLLRNYRQIVAPQKCDVLQTIYLPEKRNMQVSRSSNFQGSTIRPIVPRQNTLLFYCSPLLQKIIYFQLFKTKAVKAKCKIGEKKTDKNPLNAIFNCFIFYKPACLQKNVHGRLLSSRVFRALWAELRSLSTHVFETRTVTGSVLF